MPSTSISAAARQRRHLVGRARRIRLLEVAGHDLVDLGEVAEVLHQDRHLDHVVEAAARRGRHRAQVAEHLVRLRLDAFDEVAGLRIEADLAGQVDRVAGADRLRIRAERGRRVG